MCLNSQNPHYADSTRHQNILMPSRPCDMANIQNFKFKIIPKMKAITKWKLNYIQFVLFLVMTETNRKGLNFNKNKRMNCGQSFSSPRTEEKLSICWN